MAVSRKIFVNMPVQNLKASRAFFEKLGFAFNPQFSDDNGASMVLSDQGYVMLLQKPYFQTFTKRELADASKVTEMLVALSCDSREEVDALVKTALENGAKPAMPPQDHGFMYGHSFYDLDDHHWEVFWMDPTTAT